MKLSEKCIMDSFTGKKVNEDRLNEIFRKNGSNGYIAYCSNLHHRFGITDRLYGEWEYSYIDYRVSISLNGTEIENGSVNKYREGCYGHGRPIVHVLTPTQQELRVARRILEYITE